MPLANDIAPRAARCTAPLEGVVHHLGIALGGRPAARLARRFNPLLRVLRRVPVVAGPVQVIGIDDFAWKRGQRYGMVVCDLEQRCIIDLLPDREPATVTAWLADNPEITVASRDRGAGYRQAASKGAPQAVQVADRWHLMENVSAPFLEAMRRSMETPVHELSVNRHSKGPFCRRSKKRDRNRRLEPTAEYRKTPMEHGRLPVRSLTDVHDVIPTVRWIFAASVNVMMFREHLVASEFHSDFLGLQSRGPPLQSLRRPASKQ